MCQASYEAPRQGLSGLIRYSKECHRTTIPDIGPGYVCYFFSGGGALRYLLTVMHVFRRDLGVLPLVGVVAHLNDLVDVSVLICWHECGALEGVLRHTIYDFTSPK
jgi:hypothetical protein